MQMWQIIVIALVAFASVGWMSLAIVRLFSRPAPDRASIRPGTAVESGLVGGSIPEGARVFDGWSYRVGARFAGRVRITVYEDRVADVAPDEWGGQLVSSE